MCGIYLTKEAPSAEAIAVVEGLMRESTENKYKYMWLNVPNQERFSKVFAVEDYPHLVIFSHGKRKKYVIHEGEFTKSSIRKNFVLGREINYFFRKYFGEYFEWRC